MPGARNKSGQYGSVRGRRVGGNELSGIWLRRMHRADDEENGAEAKGSDQPKEARGRHAFPAGGARRELDRSLLLSCASAIVSQHRDGVRCIRKVVFAVQKEETMKSKNCRIVLSEGITRLLTLGSDGPLKRNLSSPHGSLSAK
jgi:hypothetical protein